MWCATCLHPALPQLPNHNHAEGNGARVCSSNLPHLFIVFLIAIVIYKLVAALMLLFVSTSIALIETARRHVSVLILILILISTSIVILIYTVCGEVIIQYYLT